jgi:IclR family transcriptional regulator, pca regulon regulatory protein
MLDETGTAIALLSGEDGASAIVSDASKDPGGLLNGRSAGSEGGLRPSQFSQSLARGLAVLLCFSPERPTLSVAEISHALGMTRSTAHRYASTLVALRYLQQDEQRRYGLATGSSDVGRSALNATPLRTQARPQLEKLRSDTGCTVALAVLEGATVLYVDRLPSPHTTAYDVELPVGAGSRLPADGTALGRVLLDQLGASEVAFEDEDLATDLRSIAAPVYDDGSVVAAVGITVPSATHTRARLASEIGPVLLDCAARISAVISDPLPADADVEAVAI